MPYAWNDADNATQMRTLTWQKEYIADIISNWDAWPFRSGLQIRETKNKAGGKCRWLVNVNRPIVQGTAYIAPDYAHTVVKKYIPAEFEFVAAFNDVAVPEEELDFIKADPINGIDLLAAQRDDMVKAEIEFIKRSAWNATGILPGQMTGLDAAINDIVGCNVYATINRTLYPRWQANVDRTAFVLWAGTISTNIWPLYLRSNVNGQYPNVMVMSIPPMTVFHRLSDTMNFNTRVNPKPAPAGRYFGSPSAMTFMDMSVEWGGDNMPAGAAGVDIFGLRMDDIVLEHVTDSLVVASYGWEVNQNNHFLQTKTRIHCQYAVHDPEKHFRVINATIPTNPLTGH